MAEEYPVIWTKDQVDALNASQGGYGHPYTCGSGNRTDAAHKAYQRVHGGDFGQLVATARGWICPSCDYRQFHTADFKFQGAIPNPLAALDHHKAP